MRSRWLAAPPRDQTTVIRRPESEGSQRAYSTAEQTSAQLEFLALGGSWNTNARGAATSDRAHA
jgi:hypothetical protein